MQLDIVQQEYIHQAGLSQTDLVKAAFSAQGNWLATVEQRQEKESDLELQMKLWAYDEQMQRYSCASSHVDAALKNLIDCIIHVYVQR